MTQLKEFRVEKYMHISVPRRPFIVFRNQKLTIKFLPTESGIYELPNDEILKDQNDFNKGGGVVFNPFNPDKNSALLGWRWNKEKKLFQYVPYFNVNGANIFDETNLTEAAPDKTIEMVLKFTKNSIMSNILIDGKVDQTQVAEYGKTNVPLILWGSQPYFGGNKRSPKDLSIYMSYERT